MSQEQALPWGPRWAQGLAASGSWSSESWSQVSNPCTDGEAFGGIVTDLGSVLCRGAGAGSHWAQGNLGAQELFSRVPGNFLGPKRYRPGAGCTTSCSRSLYEPLPVGVPCSHAAPQPTFLPLIFRGLKNYSQKWAPLGWGVGSTSLA